MNLTKKHKDQQVKKINNLQFILRRREKCVFFFFFFFAEVKEVRGFRRKKNEFVGMKEE